MLEISRRSKSWLCIGFLIYLLTVLSHIVLIIIVLPSPRMLPFAVICMSSADFGRALQTTSEIPSEALFWLSLAFYMQSSHLGPTRSKLNDTRKI